MEDSHNHTVREGSTCTVDITQVSQDNSQQSLPDRHTDMNDNCANLTKICCPCCVSIPSYEQVNQPQSSDLGELSKVKKELEELRKYYNHLEQRLCEMSEEMKVLRTNHDHYRDVASQYELQSAKEKLGKKRSIVELYDEVSSQLRDVLHPYFTDTQIDYFVTQEPVRHWSEEDIAHALEFRAACPKGYNYVRDQLKLPYPGDTTLRRWTKKQVTNLNQDVEHCTEVNTEQK